MAIMAKVAKASFPLAHHLMRSNGKTYAQEKRLDREQLQAHFASEPRYLRLDSAVRRAGEMPRLENRPSKEATRGNEGHGISFDRHAYSMLVFGTEGRSQVPDAVKILPLYEALYRDLESRGREEFQVPTPVYFGLPCPVSPLIPPCM